MGTEELTKPLWLKVLVTAGLLFLPIAGGWTLYRFGSPLPCMVYRLTGLKCAGCGTGRALTAAVHGDLVGAFFFNPILVVLIPLLAYLILKMYLKFMTGKELLPFFGNGINAYIVIISGMMLYMILRNLFHF